jgi:phosphohistidine phosphatase
MKNLIIIRHAKSSWEHQVTDFERPLKRRGIKDARMISNHVKNKIFIPDLILCSDSKRTRSTAQIFIENLDFQDAELQFCHDLYAFSVGSLIENIKICNDSVNNLMLFGHNHAITDFTNTFGSTHFENVPTCGLIHIRFNIDSWKNLNKGETIFSVFPKNLK